MALESEKLFQLSKNSREGLRDYAKKAYSTFLSTWNIRNSLQEIDTYYMREGNLGYDNVTSKLKNRQGDKSKFRDFTVPIVMPQVESALSYLTNVFLTGYPIFPVGASPEYADAALQLETIFADHAKRAKWATNLQKAFRDNLKYNLMGLLEDWDEITTWDITTDPTFSSVKGKPVQKLWEGNFLKAMDLYNTFWDIRVQPAQVHTHGEYAGYTELLTRPVFKEYINKLYGKIPAHVAEMALESNYMVSYDATSIGHYYIPQINPDAFINNALRSEFNWIAWATASDIKGRPQGIKFSNVYARTKLYCRIIPSDFNIVTPEANHCQIWELCIINNSVLLYAKRKTNAHNNLPIVFGQAQNDGLGYQTKSFASNVLDMQDIASTFMNMNIASKRRLLTDRLLYDPLRIREADINSSNPAAKIPVRPSAYGKTIADAVHQLPFRDEMADRLVTESDYIVRQANLTNGQNPAAQGQFVKGNKSRKEYEDVMGHSNSRNQMIAFNIEHDTLVDVKEMLVINVLQNQAGGDIYNSSKQQTVKIDPIALRKAVTEFKVSDGMLPEEKQMNTEEFAVALQTLQAVPAIGQEYELGKAFNHLMQQKGVDLKPFAKSPARKLYEQQRAAWQQQATLAAQSGAPFSSPQPQPSQELMQEMQQSAKPNDLLSILQQTAPQGPQAAPPPASPNPA